MISRQALVVGLHRGRIELRQTMRTPREYLGHLGNPAMFLFAASLQTGNISGSSVASSRMVIAGGVASLLLLVAMVWLPQQLATEREDGTLLRLRGTPGGMFAYLVAKTLMVITIAVLSTVLLLVGGAVLTDSGFPRSPGQWCTLLWVITLGLVALALTGAAIGAVLPNPRQALAWVMIPMFGLLFVSGIFFPVTSMPQWLQIIGQVFPLKWIAQGIRSALLPDSALVAETAQSWQHWETFGVLGAWTLLGLLLAPRLLLNSSRRESGSRLMARREVVGQRSY
ncbi:MULTISPECIES: ABC transporter permease [unclassified Streptomyces]|uniref:ABC transporter permease n=1 Tax=unclassified Streptomyces TaxID=2593676 RepID=UPI0019A6D591|nr:transport permease protein [Streptomyces kurssanovii]